MTGVPVTGEAPTPRNPTGRRRSNQAQRLQQEVSRTPESFYAVGRLSSRHSYPPPFNGCLEPGFAGLFFFEQPGFAGLFFGAARLRPGFFLEQPGFARAFFWSSPASPGLFFGFSRLPGVSEAVAEGEEGI